MIENFYKGCVDLDLLEDIFTGHGLQQRTLG